MIEQLPKADPREQKIISLMEAEVGDKVVTDDSVYKITNIDSGLLTLKLVGRKNGSDGEFLIKTAEDLADQMLDKNSRVIKKKKETEETPEEDTPEVVMEEPVAAPQKPKKSKGNNGKGVLNNEIPQDLVSKKRDKSTRWGDTEEQKSTVGKKNNADKILDNLDTTPPGDLNLQEVSDWETGVPEEALEINETPIEKPKKKVPLNLKRGDVIWNELGDEVVVLDVVTEPKNEKLGLMDGYVLLGFEPKPGRNEDFTEEKVPFSKLEKRKGKIFLTEQTPFVEIDHEEEGGNQEPPPLPAEYLEKVRAEKSLAEGRRLAQLREEISHGDLGADLAQHWTPINVEMPKRESAPLSKFAKKTVKKPWWQRLLGL